MSLDNIVGSPLVMPGSADGAPVDVVVADAGGSLYLVKLAANGVPTVRRTWKLKGKVTSGPFLGSAPGQELRVGCVVDDKNLVWIDPTGDQELWTHAAEDTIVGTPIIDRGAIILADESGLIAALDPATGQPLGKGYRLRGTIIPASGTTLFGTNRLFRPARLLVPLTDGTMVLIRMGQLIGF